MFSISDSTERVIKTLDYLFDKICTMNDFVHKNIDYGSIDTLGRDETDLYISVRADSSNSRIELYNHKIEKDGTPDYSTVMMCAGLTGYNIASNGYHNDNNIIGIQRTDEYYQVVSQPGSPLNFIGTVFGDKSVNYGPFTEENWFQLSTSNDVLPYEVVKYMSSLAEESPWDCLCFWYNPTDDYQHFDIFNKFIEEKEAEWRK